MHILKKIIYISKYILKNKLLLNENLLFIFYIQ